MIISIANPIYDAVFKQQVFCSANFLIKLVKSATNSPAGNFVVRCPICRFSCHCSCCKVWLLRSSHFSVRMEFTSYSMPLISSRFHPRSCLRRGRDGVATKTQGSRPVLFYVSPSGANSNRSNPIQAQIQTVRTQIQTVRTQFKPKFKPHQKQTLAPMQLVTPRVVAIAVAIDTMS